jgi:hypothetical protein
MPHLHRDTDRDADRADRLFTIVARLAADVRTRPPEVYLLPLHELSRAELEHALVLLAVHVDPARIAGEPEHRRVAGGPRREVDALLTERFGASAGRERHR